MNAPLDNSIGTLTGPIPLSALGDELREISGALPVARLERLCALLLDQDGEVTVELQFAKEQASELHTVRGRLAAEVQLTCQRCLEPMPWRLDTRLKLALVANSADEKAVLPDYEAVSVTAGEVNLLELLEDELLLCLPISPRHQQGADCSEPDVAGNQTLIDDAEPGEGSGPFAILQQLKSVQPSEKH